MTATATRTLGDLIASHGVDVLEHLDRDMDVPVLSGLQFQGDLAIIPAPKDFKTQGTEVPASGIAVIEAVGSGHEHRLLAGAPGTASWQAASASGQDIGTLVTSEPAYLAHPEHGYLGLAPGSYTFRRQREQAQEERLVAD